MSSPIIMSVFRAANSTNLAICNNKFHTSFTIYLNQKWRTEKGLVKNPNSSGPLLNLPDYSYQDNRPVPYGSRQLGRIQKHQDFMRRIVKLVGEVDYAVERHARLTKEQEEQRKQILDSKLKPKGQKLITSE
ncbi:mitochondrial ribosomal protein L52 [Xylocopa sonorina]|uniref:mitochondrial ribosomal protein L52 n=1 Tax=Xylocopa sonorina TaxID=1818115 RepID=UPI00403B2F52